MDDPKLQNERLQATGEPGQCAAAETSADRATLIDHDYRQLMIEAAGVDAVTRMTTSCLEDSRQLVSQLLPVRQEAIDDSRRQCHRLAGSCAAAGLVLLSSIWYELERLVMSEPDESLIEAEAERVIGAIASTELALAGGQELGSGGPSNL